MPGVRALCFGWMQVTDSRKTFPPGTLIKNVFDELKQEFMIGVSAWCDADPNLDPDISITPSQTWTWFPGDDIAKTVVHAQVAHQNAYGPGGKWHGKPIVGEDIFVDATRRLSKFILAGMAWLGQKIIVPESGHIERHRRKEFDRKIPVRRFNDVQVVHLRKQEREDTERATGTEKKEWSGWWTVGGHWRNQACGPNWSDHRPVYILPYTKGDVQKPFIQPRKKVFEVGR